VVTLFPLSYLELKAYHIPYELKEKLHQFLVFGNYPEVYTAGSDEDSIEILQELVGSYLLKDVLGYDRLRSPRQLIDLLKLLAFQVGQEVSIHELAQNIGLNVRTVERYLYLLEKGFVIYRLGAYSKNLRSEITKKSKYFFYDNGIRNGIILQFNALDMRNDTGQLWENFLVTERLKYLQYTRKFVNRYFWRNYRQQEVDYIEEMDNLLFAYEFKWGKKHTILPAEFSKSYSVKEYKTINRDNYLDFIM
jgi:predicted AAA+ superfamily ATPase